MNLFGKTYFIIPNDENEGYKFGIIDEQGNQIEIDNNGHKARLIDVISYKVNYSGNDTQEVYLVKLMIEKDGKQYIFNTIIDQEFNQCLFGKKYILI